MKNKVVSKKVSMPVAVGLSIGAAVILMLLSCAVIASMILSGNIQEDLTGIVVKFILAVAVFIGIKINITLQKQDKYIAAGIYTGALSILILIAGVAFKIKVTNILMNMLFVFCGAGVGLLLVNKKIKKQTYSKRHYR